MKKTPSALKWLAEKRARIAGQLASCLQVVELIESDMATLSQEVANVQALLVEAERRRARLTEELTAIDRTVTLYDEKIVPESIGTINAWQGNYGKRGALKNFLCDTLKGRAPEFIQTSELALMVVMEFSLVFEHKDLRNAWYSGSFRGTLKLLAAQGHIERSHGLVNTDNATGSWRWKQEKALTLAGLRLQ
jgi:hypothetical protein